MEYGDDTVSRMAKETIYGLRIGEVTALKWDCITDKEVIIKRSISDGKLREATKTGKSRCYGKTERALQILKVVPRPCGQYSFVRNAGGIPYTRKVLTGYWKKACKKSGSQVGQAADSTK